MSLKLPKNTSLKNLYLEDDQTIWFLIWILKQSSPCDQYISQMILESPFQVIQDIDGIYSRQYILKNWKKHCRQRAWYESGQLWYEQNWKNGLLYGLARGWHQNGQLHYEENWKNNRKHGLHRGWYNNGQLMYKRYWKNGQPLYYAENGSKNHEIP